MLYDILEGDWIEDAPDMVEARQKAAQGSNVLLTSLRDSSASRWSCGHLKALENTHTIGDRKMCRRCRRARWKDGFQRTVIRAQLARIARLEKAVVRNKAVTGRLRDTKRRVSNLQEVNARLLGIVHGESGRLPMDVIFAEIETAFSLPSGGLLGDTRQVEYVSARAVAIRIFRDRGYSLSMIARLIKRKDHSTVLHALVSFGHYAHRDPRVMLAYRALCDKPREMVVRDGD